MEMKSTTTVMCMCEKLAPEFTNNNKSFSTLDEIIAKTTDDDCGCYTCPVHNNNTNGSYIHSFHQYILIFHSSVSTL